MSARHVRLDRDRTGSGDQHTREVIDAVLCSPLFAGMGEAEVVDTLEAFDEQSFNAGHSITLQGYKGSDFYVIAAGRATVSAVGAQVATLEAGDFFGEMGVLGTGLRIATVSAETPLRCLVLANRGLEAVISAHPVVGINLLRHVVSRFQDLSTVRDILAERPLVRR